MAQNESAHQSNQSPVRRTPLFFREENAGFIARGNFMTLALKPQLVEEGEWLAHQGKPRSNSVFPKRTLTSQSVRAVPCPWWYAQDCPGDGPYQRHFHLQHPGLP